jgi:hypothetical protein
MRHVPRFSAFVSASFGLDAPDAVYSSLTTCVSARMNGRSWSRTQSIGSLFRSSQNGYFQNPFATPKGLQKWNAVL